MVCRTCIHRISHKIKDNGTGLIVREKRSAGEDGKVLSCHDVDCITALFVAELSFHRTSRILRENVIINTGSQVDKLSVLECKEGIGIRIGIFLGNHTVGGGNRAHFEGIGGKAGIRGSNCIICVTAIGNICTACGEVACFKNKGGIIAVCIGAECREAYGLLHGYPSLRGELYGAANEVVLNLYTATYAGDKANAVVRNSVIGEAEVTFLKAYIYIAGYIIRGRGATDNITHFRLRAQ